MSAPGAFLTLEERSDLVLALARTLYINGQSTDETLVAAERLGHHLGVRARIFPRWGALQLQIEDGDARRVSTVVANPTGVDMDRVASAMQALEDLCAGRLAPAAATEALGAISEAPPAPTWLFTLAAAAGAVALGVLFGVQHPAAAALISVSAAAGAVLRRGLGRYSANVFLQPFCAALLAGVVGALAVRYQLSSPLRLIAVCPCMILVPGPHVLNGAMDLIEARVHLGAARMIYAGLVILAISSGLLLGLALLGVSLPISEAGRAVPLWLDTIAAGVAVAAYSVFFSTPLSMLAWPVAVGMLAHALKWWSLAVLGSGAAAGGVFVACLVVGLILTPLARRSHMPFVVSMLPGVSLFRMAGGLLQLAEGSQTTLELIGATIANGASAVAVIVAMSFGLVVPKIGIDRLGDGAMPSKS